MTISAERSTSEVVGTPNAPVHRTPWTQRPGWFSQHLGTAIVVGFLGYLFGHWLGNAVASQYIYIANDGQNTVADFFGLLFMVIGFLGGIGVLNYPLAKIVGRQPEGEHKNVPGWSKYFRYTLDHKVVGIQYIVGVLLFMFTGGLLAMAIRSELLSPDDAPLLARHLYQDRERARHGHDDDGDVDHRRPVGQLPRAADDRGATHGVPAHRGVQLLGLHRRVLRDLRGAAPRRVPRPAGRATRRCRPRPALE